MRRFFLLAIHLLTLFSPRPCTSQGTVRQLLHWSEKDGLSNNRVFSATTDQYGFLWIGTGNGLCRFDGLNFELFRNNPIDSNSVSGNEIVKVFKDSRGRIWAGTDGGGASMFDYQSNKFRSFRQSLDTPQKGLTENRVYSFLEDHHHNIWLGYRAIGSGTGGLSQWHPDSSDQFRHLLIGEKDYADFSLKVTNHIQDPDNKHIFWLSGRSFFRYDHQKESLQEFPHPEMRPNLNSIAAIVPLDEQQLLVGSYFGGLLVFDKFHRQWLPKVDPIPVQDICKDPNGKIWVANRKGISIFDAEQQKFKYIIEYDDPRFSFPTNIYCYEIVPDNWGNVWLCTNHGLYFWTPLFDQFKTTSIFSEFLKPMNKPRFITALSANQYLFFDRTNGLLQTDSALVLQKQIALPPGTKGRDAKVLDKDRIIILTEKGLYEWQSSQSEMRAYQHTPSVADYSLYSLSTDSKNRIWIGTRTDGLLCIEDKSRRMRQFLKQADNTLSLCHNNYLFQTEEDSKGRTWVATDKGLSILAPSGKKFVEIPSIVQKKLGAFVIHSLEAVPQGGMWIGTRDQGLFLYEIGNGKDTLWQFTTADGLPYNGANRLLLHRNKLWISTRQGLCQFDIKQKKFTIFDQNKGLTFSNLYESPIASISDQKLILSHVVQPHFSIFQTDQIKGTLNLPRLLTSTMDILSKKPVESIAVNGLKSIDLGANENYFTLTFKGIHYIEPRRINYRYQLQGYDPEWIDAGNRSSATYTNLPGGDYQFKVQAKLIGDLWSPEQILAIHLATPWHQTLWFRLLFMMGIGLSLYGFYRTRTNRLRRESLFEQQLAETEMKALRAQINPHFIFNSLNSIKGFIIENDSKAGARYIGRFARLIRLTLNHSGEKLIPLSEEIEAIQLYTWLEQQRLQHSFEVVYEIAPSLEPAQYAIPPMLLQPYVENAIWHGLMPLKRKGRILIQMEAQTDNLVIRIEDDGIGRKAAAQLRSNNPIKRQSMGTKLTANRLEQINQLYKIRSRVETIDIESTPPDQQGTVVVIHFPIMKFQNSTHV